ncbi:unnamed protein product, partial [Prorocentrum cordatum]
MADSKPIAPGRLILVWYGGAKAYWHDRLLLCQVQGTSWVIATPDDDIYEEDIMVLGGRPCMQGSVPHTIPANALLYRLPPLGQLHSNAEWRQIFDDGIAEAQMPRAALGVDDVAADAETVAVRDRVAVHGWDDGSGLPGGQAAAAPPAAGGALVPAAAGPPAGAAPPLAGGGAPAAGGAGVLAPPPGAAARPAGPAVVAPAGGAQWIVVASDGQPGAPSVGQDWSVDANAIIQGRFAFVKLGAATLVLECVGARKRELEAAIAAVPAAGRLAAAIAGPPTAGAPASADSPVRAADARALPVLCDQMGQRFRPCADGVGLLEEPPWKDFPIQGPRTILRLCNFIRDQGCVPRTRTEKWMRDAHIPDSDRVKHQHGSVMEAYNANPKAPRFEGGEHFQGLGKKVAAVAPLFTSRVALQLQGEGDGEILFQAWLMVASVASCRCLATRRGEEKLKATVLHFYPNLKRLNTKPLARFERPLKAWRRRRPALGRLPSPYPTVCGLAVALHLVGRTGVAVAVLVALSAYLRPGELCGLCVRDVAPPAVGFGPAYQSWSLILGPSDDNGDPQLEVQRRDRCASISTLIISEKSSEVNARLVELPPDVQEYREFCCSHLGDVLLGR